MDSISRCLRGRIMDKKDIASFGYDELIEEMKKYRREGVSGETDL